MTGRLNTTACPRCGSTNPAAAKFCRVCGAALAQSAASTRALASQEAQRLPVGEVVTGEDGADRYVILTNAETGMPRTYEARSLHGGARVWLHETTRREKFAGMLQYGVAGGGVPFVTTLEPSFIVQWFDGERIYVPEQIPSGARAMPRTADEWAEYARQLAYGMAILHDEAGVAFDLAPDACASHVFSSQGEAMWHQLRDLVPLQEKPDAAHNDVRALLNMLRRLVATMPHVRALLDGSAAARLSAGDLSRALGAPQHTGAARPEAPRLNVDVGHATDKGLQREMNEDDCAVEMSGDEQNPTLLLAVADGMGGEEAGEVASALTIQSLQQSFAQLAPGGAAQLNAWVQQAVARAGEVVEAEAKQRNNQMGSTLVLALVHAGVACLGNVGDSRIYRWNPARDRGRPARLTKDHSLVQRLVDMGQIKDEDRYSHPERNMVLRTIGDARAGKSDVNAPVPLQAGDWLLLCSDGLWEMVRDEQIGAILASSRDAQQACDRLIAEANRNGGEDNITAVIAHFTA
jgi:serine/threonine protein phosphatase PrpC